jgi:hypothetical protein
MLTSTQRAAVWGSQLSTIDTARKQHGVVCNKIFVALHSPAAPHYCIILLIWWHATAADFRLSKQRVDWLQLSPLDADTASAMEATFLKLTAGWALLSAFSLPPSCNIWQCVIVCDVHFSASVHVSTCVDSGVACFSFESHQLRFSCMNITMYSHRMHTQQHCTHACYKHRHIFSDILTCTRFNTVHWLQAHSSPHNSRCHDGANTACAQSSSRCCEFWLRRAVWYWCRRSWLQCTV